MAYLEWVRSIKKRQDNDWDTVVVIDGEEGSGKSNCAMNVALSLAPKYDPRSVIYNHEDFGNTVTIRKKQTIVVDEGGNLTFSRDFNVWENKELIKFTMVMRQMNATLIICMPNFEWIDRYFREHRTTYRVHMENRNRAVVTRRIRNWRKAESWFQDMFAFRPVNLKAERPDFWRVYLRRKHAAFEYGSSDSQASQPPRSSQEASTRAGSAAATNSHQQDRPLTDAEKSLVLAKTGRNPVP